MKNWIVFAAPWITLVMSLGCSSVDPSPDPMPTLGGPVAMPNPGPTKVLDTLQGTSYLAVQAALKTLQRHRLDLTRRTIVVMRDGESTVVIFTGSEGQVGARISPEAELIAADMERLATARVNTPILDSIQGSSLPAIQTAAEVFERRRPDLSPFRITLMSERDSVVVAFTDKDGAPGGVGSPGSIPGFEVEMSAADLSVRRSNFIR